MDFVASFLATGFLAFFLLAVNGGETNIFYEDHIKLHERSRAGYVYNYYYNAINLNVQLLSNPISYLSSTARSADLSA